MKTIKFNSMMIAVAIAIAAAFAFQPKAVKASPTTFFWYAVQDSPGHYVWESTPPANYSCQSGNATCEISVTTTGTPTANQLPASYSVVQGPDQMSEYKPQ
ncbi:MAG: hypothetical protein JWQ66_2106 [Mucilaginibacter sp.]|nr:hypothetical protein [Mucilaginibacter sp.]